MVNYIHGNLFDFIERPTSNDVSCRHVIVHVVNDVGAWGRGFVLNLSKHFVEPEKHYRKNWSSRRLGDVDIVTTDRDDVVVANVFGQHGLRSLKNKRPVDYDALFSGLVKLKEFANSQKVKIVFHMPKIGSGLGGGNWEIIEMLVDHALREFETNVYCFGN